MAISVHDLFDASDSDITIISSDNIAFKLHRKYLESNTGVFPGPEVVDAKEEPIQLTEPANILAIVFQFIYPKRHPKLKEENFETVLAVAEAAGKYQVFSAMNTCEARLIKDLTDCSPDQADEALVHAIKHDYPDLINAAVPRVGRAPLMPFLEKLPPYAMFPWIRYQEAWKSIFRKASEHVILKRNHSNITLCVNCRHSLIGRITELERLETLSALNSSLDSKLDADKCSCRYDSCREGFYLWQREARDICREGIKNMAPFTDFFSRVED